MKTTRINDDKIRNKEEFAFGEEQGHIEGFE